MFHVSLLEPYTRRFDTEVPPPADIEGELEWNVEAVLDERVKGKGRNKRHELLIRWEGYSPTEDSWEPTENLAKARGKVQEFRSKRSEREVDRAPKRQ